MSDKNKVKNNSTSSRSFDYSKDGVTLTFTLRTDIKDQLLAFAELLKVATLEVNNEINK